jgi:hypothetical protein
VSKPAGERYTVAVDFDGVIHSYTSPWEEADIIPDPPVEGAIEWLLEIAKKFEVVIFTTRAKTVKGRMAVRGWLRMYGVHCQEEQVTAEKPAALIYLDDRAYRFEGPGTYPTSEQIHAARPWNKRR